MVVKSTINLSAELKKELNYYVENQIIPSFSSGVNAAIELYINWLKKEAYALKMKEAGKDKAFLSRTMLCQNEFDSMDGGIDGQW